MKPPIILAAEQAARPLDVGGFKITVLASSAQTGGYELLRIEGPEGTGPGPHPHAGDESFFVLRGAVHCGVDASQVLATVGDPVHVPGGCTHWFRFAPGGGESFSITSRGNASRMFKAFDEGINWADPDRRALVALAASHGQTVLAPPSPAAPALVAPEPAAPEPTSPASKPSGAGPTTAA
ncbi:MAG: cupin domain-containing protein [Planctomycetia bacterium]